MAGQEQKERHEETGMEEVNNDPVIHMSQVAIRHAVRVLAVLMVFVILWGVLDVVWMLYNRLADDPVFLLDISDILAVFGALLAVLIAIEFFINITLYLREDVFHVKLVVATALMAVARKVIVFDYNELQPDYILATAAVVLSLGITYWLISKKD